MGCAAFRAFPRPHVQRHVVLDKPATGTAFAGREKPPDLNVCPAMPASLVLKLPGELPPACICNVLDQFRVLDHVLHSEVFNADNLVLVN